MEVTKRRALLLEVHEAIREQSEQLTGQICDRNAPGSITYPPGAELAAENVAALRALSVPGEAQAAIQKLAADAISAAFFRFFTILDGVGDPAHFDGEWLPLTLTEAPDDAETSMWHDDFFESYWEWHCRTPDPSGT